MTTPSDLEAIDGCVGIFVPTDDGRLEWCTAHKRPHDVCSLQEKLTLSETLLEQGRLKIEEQHAENTALKLRIKKVEAERDDFRSEAAHLNRWHDAFVKRLEQAIGMPASNGEYNLAHVLEDLKRERDGAFAEVQQLTNACFEYSSQLRNLRLVLEAIASINWTEYDGGGPIDCTPKEKGLLQYVGKVHELAREALKELCPLSDYSKYDKFLVSENADPDEAGE